ncbi:MAG: hypothetical protein QOF30_704 [Acidimicrobiaceae bacterium]|jgi:hypothetical protein|nr:hypothetical protein [Acidimicrobiaceae bacterium]
MEELPEETIEEAEEVSTAAHSHDDITSENDSLIEHLRSCHQLEAEPGLSASTQEGLHDRLHSTTKATDE